MAYTFIRAEDLPGQTRPADQFSPRGMVRVFAFPAEGGKPFTVDFAALPAGSLIYCAAERMALDDMNAARRAAGLAPVAKWEMEFPDQSGDHMPTIPAGFEDMSWHNDMCPRFDSAALNLSLWVEHSDPEGREFPEMDRFTIYEGTSESDHMNDEPSLSSNDWSDVVAFIAEREGRDPKAARLQYLDELAREAMEAASNAMALTIQRALGVESGDLAALWFDGAPESDLTIMAREYIEAERDFAEQPEA